MVALPPTPPGLPGTIGLIQLVPFRSVNNVGMLYVTGMMKLLDCDNVAKVSETEY